MEPLTLADAFLADLNTSDSEEEHDENPDTTFTSTSSKMEDDIGLMVDLDEDDNTNQTNSTDTTSSAPVTRILTNPKMKNHFDRINAIQGGELVDREEEITLLVNSHRLTKDLESEIVSVSRLLRDLMTPRFPELEQLVQNPLDYVKSCVRCVSATDLTSVHFEDILPPHTVMVVTVTASTTIGKPLNEDQQKHVIEVCNTIEKLYYHLEQISLYVESRMEIIAPNLTILVGSHIASRLIEIAGGVSKLSLVPSCNILVFGTRDKAKAPYRPNITQNSTLHHTGIISQCEIMKETPPILKSKVARLIAGKISLAARIDAYSDSKDKDYIDNSKGREFKEEILRKIDHWCEPPPAKQKKALPLPIEQARKKRGGRKLRKLKERMQLTDLQKQRNRMSFGKAENEIDGVSMGQYGEEDSGSVRIRVTNVQRLGDRMANKQKKQIKKRGYVDGAGGTVSTFLGRRTPIGQASGLASSLAFTPVQGIELVNPDAEKERLNQLKKISDKYFTDSLVVKKDTLTSDNNNMDNTFQTPKDVIK